MSQDSLLNKIGGFIGRYAPILGDVIPIPGAGSVLKMVGAAFGASSDDELLEKMQTDPEVAIKLLEIQNNTKIQLQQILASNAAREMQHDETLAATEASDKASAREMAVNLSKNGKADWVAHSLAILFCIGYFAVGYYVLSSTAPSDDIIVARIQDLMVMIVSFYFGSSYGSRKRDDGKN